jgi:hypothetical protein
MALQKQRQSSKPAAACRWKSTVCNRFRVIVKRDQGDYKKNDYVLTSGNGSARGFQQDAGDGFSRSGLSYSFMQSSWLADRPARKPIIDGGLEQT